MKFIASLICIMILAGCSAELRPSLDLLVKDYEAALLLKREKYEEALQVYLDMAASDPSRPRVHSNAAVLLSHLQKPEEALKSLEHALQLAQQQKDREAEFAIHFNLGVHHGKKQDVSAALLSYQAALEIMPSSKEVKTNIELLIQQQQQKGNQGQDSQQQQSNSGGEGQNQQNQQNPQQQQQNQGENQDQQKQGQQNQDQQKQEVESSARYKPRPYQGEQLSEGDVKKILGELRNQEQKIRANFDKKEKRKSGANDKDW